MSIESVEKWIETYKANSGWGPYPLAASYESAPITLTDLEELVASAKKLQEVQNILDDYYEEPFGQLNAIRWTVED